MAKYRYYALAALSGLLLGLAYPGWGFSLGWLAWIGLIPLLWALSQFTQKSDRFCMRTSFLIGFATGLTYFLIVFRWLWSVYPLDTIGINGRFLSLLGVAAVYLISSAGMALFWGLFGLVSNFWFLVFSKKSDDYKLPTTNYQLFLVVPALFVLLEYLRSWGFGFLWAGSGSLFGPHWTLGNLAYALAANPLALKLASFVGIYGVTFLVILVNILLTTILVVIYTRPYKSYHWKIVRNFAPVFVAVAVITAVGFLTKLLPPNQETGIGNKKINFAIIQTAQQTRIDPSPQEKLAGFKEQLELLNRVAKEHPESQLIVFPEASDFFTNLSLFLTPTQAQDYFSKLFKEPRLVISGSRILDSATGKAYSRVFSLDTHGDIIGFYDKRLVAPGGEFLPYPLKFLVYLFSKNASSLFNQFRDLRPGQKEVSTVGFRYQFNVAPIICSEAMAPGLIKKTTQNSDVIVSMASYSAFHGNRTIADQMFAITRFRAAENRKPIITATNMGRSYVIDAMGNIVYMSGPHPVKSEAFNGAGILTGAVDITRQQSWYNKVGDTPVLLGCLLLAIITILKVRVGQIKNWLRRNQS